VNRAYTALREAIHKASDKAKLEKQLDQGRKELEKIRAAVLDLKARKEKGFDTKAYRDRLKRESKDLPDAAKERLLALQQERRPLLDKLKEQLQGEVSPSKAEESLRKAEEDLRSLHLKLINAYENEFQRAQEEIQEDLRKEYVQSLFPESIELKLPVLKSFKEKTEGYTVNFTTPGTTGWYQPMAESWPYHGNGGLVDLADLWNKADTYFQNLLENAQNHIKSGHEQLIKEYLAFMAGEFDKHFDKLIADLEDKLSDQKLREAAIDKAEKQLHRINILEAELDAVLKV
jgi:hypothetical protein